MTSQKHFIAIKAHIIWFLLCALCLTGMGGAFAQSVGTVTDLSGPLVARKASGVVKVLSQKSTVDPGDVLESEKNTYARIKFIDNSEITLRPSTQFKIEAFSYDEAKPEADSSVFSLIKGGLRSITGLLGKRSKEKYKLNTPAATIGIRGTTFIAQYIPPKSLAHAGWLSSSYASLDGAGLDPIGATRSDAGSPNSLMEFGAWPRNNQSVQVAQNTPADPTPSSGLNPGLYVQVLDGAINVSNNGGSQNFTAGQFGYTPNFEQPPVILPSNPGLEFDPPPSFSTGTGGSTTGAKPGDVDCVVR